MSKIIIEENIDEILESKVKQYGDSNSYVSVPKRHVGKKAKILILKGR